MRLIFDGMTQVATIPADPGNYAEFNITYRPLASYEMDIWRRTAGPGQIGLVQSKLKSWGLVCDDATAAWLNADEKRGGRKDFKAGDRLPITEAVLSVLPGLAFETIYLACMGMLLGTSGKTGEQEKAEAEKN